MQFSPDPTLTQTAFTSLGLAIQRTVEADNNEGVQFTRLERYTSCNQTDRSRFNIPSYTEDKEINEDKQNNNDKNEKNESNPELEILSMEEILKIKANQRTIWRTRNEPTVDISLQQDIEESTDYFDKNVNWGEDYELFRNGVDDLVNLSGLGGE